MYGIWVCKDQGSCIVIPNMAQKKYAILNLPVFKILYLYKLFTGINMCSL